jgi:hypothetical protein
LDKKYFLRNKQNNRLKWESYSFKSNNKFKTSHDFIVAKIKANEEIQNYIYAKLKKNNTAPAINKPQITHQLQWTGSKVALIELMYALQTECVMSNGNLSLKEIASEFEKIFNVEIGQFHRTFIEIQNRKTIEKTNFLNKLKISLLKRIEEADEKPNYQK